MGVSHHWKQAAVRWYLLAKTPIRHAVVSQLNWAIIGIWQNNGWGGFTACHCFSFNLIASFYSHWLLILLDGRFLLKRSFPQSGPNSARLLFTIIGSLHITLSPCGHVMGIFSFAPVDHGDHGMLLDEMYHILKTHPPKCTKREWFGGSHRDGWVHWRPFTRVLPPTYIP